MNKEKIAKMFFDSFGTDIEKIVTEGQMPSSGHDTNGKHGEIIFFNHSTYEKKEFSADFHKFAKKLAKEYGVDVKDIKTRESRGSKSFYYVWDAEQIITVDGVKFRMGRRMYNKPHTVLDGVGHTYYIDINDVELVEEIKKLNDQKLAEKKKKAEEEWPGKVEKAKAQCREMIEDLQKWIDGENEFDDRAVGRIAAAHFEVSVVLKH